MRRGIRGGKWKTPGSQDSRPPGLKGKEIGLYYRDKYRQNPDRPKTERKYAIRLEIPDTVVEALNENIKSIEQIAEKENIFLEPIKLLKFMKSNTAGADFIPLKTTESEKELHHVTNIFPRDNDVIFVSKDEPNATKKSMKRQHICFNNDTDDNDKDDVISVKTEPMVISDDSGELTSSDLSEILKDEVDTKQPNNKKNAGDMAVDVEIDIKSDKDEPRNAISTHKALDIDTGSKAMKSESKTDIKPVIACSSSDDIILLDDVDDIKHVKPKPKVSQAKSKSHASTSRQNQFDKADYKYGYDDIITGTFEEKLDECLAKGIAINIQNETTKELNQSLLQQYNIMVEDRKYCSMKEFRKILPTYKKAEDLLNVINKNQVVVISGETGCGKSTQVPQIILDDAIKNGRGANVKVLVTEPRRIAASSLAMRVAEERAEKMGTSVGYSVRLERVDCRSRGSIMFCTTGVLLVELEVNQSLSNYSHIILDEVHERDCQVDIAMCMLRQVLKKRKDLKLILMSATIDADRLCAYYDNCPMFHIEGLAYPVKDVYLEEILHMTHYQLPPLEYKEPRKNRQRGRKCINAIDMEKDIQYKNEIGPWLESIKRTLDRDVYRTLQDSRIEAIDNKLILELLHHISRSEPGAILVFLPGISDITKLIREMRESLRFPDSCFEIHPLHSKLPTLTQHKIFKRPANGIRKIIVATNIAETSITIDDIVYVVDCAKIKYKGLNVQDHVSTLQTEWASQANLRQRRGRAGRCQPGVCYHLVTSYRASKLPERLLPELQRDDLLEPVLQIKRLRLGLAKQALAMMPAAPHQTTIHNAVRHLQQCGALDKNETLTPLGWHLARLPVHPAAGKLLLLGALFGCLERAASVAAVWGFKDPFNIVIGKEKQIEEAKKNLALGEPSDHVSMSEALIQWENCRSQSEKYQLARDYFLSMSTLSLLSEMKKQFGQNLKQMGFLQSGDVKSTWENRNSDNLALFKAIVAASLYPNIATVRWMNLNNVNINKHPYIKVKTPEDSRVSIHPSSVMYTRHEYQRKVQSLPLCASPGANWLVYWLKQRSTDLYLIDVTLVYTLPLLFFGELNVTQADKLDECLIEIKTIKVCCKKETTQLLFQLRSLLDQVLTSKIMATGDRKRSTVFEEHVLNGVKRLITAEDARTEYLEDDDQSGSEDYSDGRRWY